MASDARNKSDLEEASAWHSDEEVPLLAQSATGGSSIARRIAPAASLAIVALVVAVAYHSTWGSASIGGIGQSHQDDSVVLRHVIAEIMIRCSVAPRVTLPSNATVVGKLLPPKGTSSGDEVNAYFNIRYATAGRFEAPTPFSAPAGSEVDGTQVNERCLQIPWGSDGKFVGSEDCLTLAMFTPKGPLKPGRSVMVWIHGGNLVAGSVGDNAGDFHHLVTKGDVIVVAIQYRLGLFGFFQPPGDSSVPANRGLRDQIEALRWVKNNIASFGGDPGSVTIWGQSAGGRSVMALYQSPMSQGLFHRAIAESPGMQTAIYFEPTAKSAATMGMRCMDATKCQSVDGLVRMDYQGLLEKCGFYYKTSEFVDKPGVYFAGYDGEVLAHPLDASLCDGVKFLNAEVPMLVGSMANEWRSFTDLKPLNMTQRFLWENMPGYASAGADEQDCAVRTFLKSFQRNQCHIPGNNCGKYGQADWMKSATDQYRLGAGLSVGPGVGPRYFYNFDIEAAGGTCGSCHCGELMLLFGTEQSSWRDTFVSPAFAESSAWQDLRAMVTDYWLSFAKTGVPTSRSGPAWTPVVAPKNRRMGMRSWGLPVMSFNLSARVELQSMEWFSDGAQDEVSSTLCRRRGLPQRCTEVAA
mmetsp:Transcript_26988/g.89551  ORF Transcript_26988/g.89551 Transcript_26988/m.89551 type:complete len:636 (+) Transcript_26988:63-1970(+)